MLSHFGYLHLVNTRSVVDGSYASCAIIIFLNTRYTLNIE